MLSEASAELRSASASPPPVPLRPRLRLARAGVRIAWVGLLLLWFASLIAALLLTIAGYQNLKQAATLPADLGLVYRAYRETSIGLMALGMLLLIYLLSWLLPVMRRFYDGERSLLTRATHLGWSFTALGWIYYAVFDSFVGVAGAQWIEYLRLLPALLLASVCFLQGTSVGREWSRSAAQTRRMAALFALGFLVLALAETLALPNTQHLTQEVSTAFQNARVPLLEAKLSPDYWLAPQSSGINAYLAKSPWFLLGYIYALSAITAHGLPTFFRACSGAPGVIRRLSSRLGPRWELLYAWLPATVALWLWRGQAWVASLLANAENQQAGEAGGQALALFLLYVPLLVWAIFYARVLAASRCDGQLQDTKQRLALIRRTRFSTWLLFLVAGLIAGNVALCGLYLGFAPLMRLTESSGRPPGQVTYWLFALAAFVGILVHYAGFEELPFWLGQRAFRAERVRQAQQALDDAEAALVRRVATGGPQAVSPPAGDDATTLDLLARWYFAREHVRVASEIPLFTLKNLGDLLLQLVNKAGASLLLPVLSPNPANPLHDLLLTTWNWLTSTPSGH